VNSRRLAMHDVLGYGIRLGFHGIVDRSDRELAL
jgi:hypothetical protein